MMIGTNVAAQYVAKRMMPGSIGVELGVWKGKSSEIFSKRTSKLHLVDSWSVEPYRNLDSWDNYLQRYSQITGGNTPEDFEKYYDEIYESVEKKFEDNDDVIIHRMDTNKFFETFKGDVDWFYVDAAHDEEGCYKDLVNSYNHLRRHGGGILFGDDYGNKKGVVKAVDRFKAERNLVMNVFHKNQYEMIV